MKDSRIEALKSVCGDCRKCDLGGTHDGVSTNVFSNLNTDAKIMVVGQNPGDDEVDQGVPFVGPSGLFFKKAVEKYSGIDPDSMYLTNIIKCHVKNKGPYPSQIASCREFLDEEIEIVKPKLIVALGGLAMLRMSGKSGIMKYHGTEIFSPRYNTMVFPVIIPSPKNTNNEEICEMIINDFKILKSVWEKING